MGIKPKALLWDLPSGVKLRHKKTPCTEFIIFESIDPKGNKNDVWVDIDDIPSLIKTLTKINRGERTGGK